MSTAAASGRPSAGEEGAGTRRQPTPPSAARGRRHRTYRPRRATYSALAPAIDSTFDLADIAGAHRRMEANDALGKIVVTVGH
ncbi:zinc-binding dehydrogenase [Actinoallomurus sp. NPDC050550]|uniref:zinc-binding dehydrogenase n=1 Tax=Actinoallomurus sp. NPDC050550 TaxID=3154937 RepID=UPI0033F06D58